MTNPYGRISGHLMHARELLDQRQPASPTEELLASMNPEEALRQREEADADSE